MNVTVRKYEEKDLPDLIRIWNEVVEDGVAFPQEECLNEETGKACNVPARHLYERLGFTQLGVIPKGFRMKDGHYEDICPYYHEL